VLKICVVGVGSIGTHHARIFSGLENVELVGVVDIRAGQAENIASRFNCVPYTNHKEIMDSVDAVSIAVPTTVHHQIALDFLKNNKDVLIEKPITSTIQEAEELISEADRRNLILQVGHIERFNPGVSLISSMVDKPRFIESHRMSPFLGRSTDIDVTLDLMIHDIDIILSLVNSEITDLRATGDKVLTDNIDVAHAWIEFKNGCIAEAVTSRMASEKTRELKIFQQNAFLTLDYQEQEVSCYKKVNNSVGRVVRKAEESEPLMEQLRSYVECVKTRTRPVVSGHEGREALKVVLKISALVNHNSMTGT
jgi:predicted dehydrogenase